MSRTVSQLNDSLVSSQRAIWAEATKVGLARNLSDLQTKMMMLKTQLLIGMEPKKKADARAMLAEFEEEEASLQVKINLHNRNFLAIVGNHVGQLQSAPLPNPMPAAVPTVPVLLWQPVESS